MTMPSDVSQSTTTTGDTDTTSPDMTVITVRKHGPSDDTPMKYVIVQDSDNHTYSVPFRIYEDDAYCRVPVGFPASGSHSNYHLAKDKAVEYLRQQDNGYTIQDCSVSDKSPVLSAVDDGAYFYARTERTHLYQGPELDALCGTATALYARQALTGLDGPLSSIDDLCPTCARELKLAGDYEAYERPSLM